MKKFVFIVLAPLYSICTKFHVWYKKNSLACQRGCGVCMNYSCRNKKIKIRNQA